MKNSIRYLIIEKYKETGKPISLEAVGAEKKISIEEVKKPSIIHPLLIIIWD